MTIEVAELASPLGPVTVAVRKGVLVATTFTDRWPAAARVLERRFPESPQKASEDPAGVLSALRRYFGGDLGSIGSLPVDPGGTEFQRRVWGELRRIPVGQTVAYRAVAEAIGAARAVRAVGAANGANPIWLVIPCHRVIAADGTLGGYGGGLERKRWLLRHEGVRV